MDIFQIENNIQKLIDSFSKETFIYNLLLAYDLPKASITRLQKGNLNLSKVKGEISWKKRVFFKEVFDDDLHVTISSLANNIQHEERFVIVTDYETFLAIDTKTQDPPLDIKLKELPKHYDFFLPWAGMEKAQYQNENPADVKAAEKMAKLFDEIKKDNPDNSPEFIHGLNVFLCRLLFCSFAEDTNIFKKNQFTNAIASHTQADGSDLNTYLEKFFEVLNTPEKERGSLPAYLNDFPYVNGGLFREKIRVPIFTRRSRQAIIDNGELDWSIINPDIFGSMMQAVMTPEHRGGLGIHYTSVPNIMRVIEPLFLNDLREAFEKSKEEAKNKGNQKKLNELLHRLETIKIFDPACGSGNFLIIAYKELRKLEMEIYKERRQTMPYSLISLRQFYGIELDDFAHEIAQLSLWLAEHQMNVEFFKQFGCTNPTLPLKEAGNIVQGNACRINWETVCPKKEGDEVYVLGNPPYQGARKQKKAQKEDIEVVFRGFPKYKNLDYIACWFYKAGNYIKESNHRAAFVSTDSICQGEQVELIWPPLFDLHLEIDFAYQSFKWKNNAKDNAGVSVVIIGLRCLSKNTKFIYFENRRKQAENINPYLIDAANIIIPKRKTSISRLPRMSFGNMPNDGGHLILSTEEMDKIISSYPESSVLFRKFVGSDEFINSLKRWCLWIEDSQLDLALSIPPIKDRVNKCKQHRLESKDSGTNKLAERPHTFRDLNEAKNHSLIIPSVSSERREYFPIGFLSQNEIISNAAQAVYDAEMYLFGVIHSKIHNVWVRSIGGKLETRIRYSAEICYNNFPFPLISDQRKEEIAICGRRILEEREKHSEKTLAELYDPNKMPKGLREAHRLNDLAVERCYRSKPFESDEERLEHLFKRYEDMTNFEGLEKKLSSETNKTLKVRV
ncbi:MAG: DNA methyltransferase [Methanosarcina mazei]|uniref:site-specific DNA-methyltransferase (adenine-specific) n=1 Tax=Methanosarcina mazei TaxID=2209 RepID=A0A6C0VGZ7_METMZ|nr:DNA methyltransferase [Methanosarcina mazei]QIB90709.1 class I SAM-dependent DNA methyltransferase [Methanosarcina mazei]